MHLGPCGGGLALDVLLELRHLVSDLCTRQTRPVSFRSSRSPHVIIALDPACQNKQTTILNPIQQYKHMPLSLGNRLHPPSQTRLVHISVSRDGPVCTGTTYVATAESNKAHTPQRGRPGHCSWMRPGSQPPATHKSVSLLTTVLTIIFKATHTAGPSQSMSLLDTLLQTTREDTHLAHCPLHRAIQ